MFVKGDRIGSGGFGTVFRGMHDPHVAIKRYNKSHIGGIQSEILREISLLKHISTGKNSRIVQLFGVQIGEYLEISMEYGGVNLRTFANSIGWKERVGMILGIAEQILEGLIYLHQNNIIHRDIKPDNILISCGNIRICDFGIAKKYLFDGQDHTLGSVGTQNYRAPEIYAGADLSYDEKVDIWSLGCLLYEFIMKKQLFKGSTDIVRLGNVVKTVPTTREDLDLLGLDIINLEKCNQTNYFKIPSLYGINCPVDSQKMLNSFKQILQHMLHINPNNRARAVDLLPKILQLRNKKTYPKIQTIEKRNFTINIPHRMINIRQDEVKWIFQTTRALATQCLAVEILDYTLTYKHNLPQTKQKRITRNMRVVSSICLGLASKYLDVVSISYSNFPNMPQNITDWEQMILQLIDFNLEFSSLYGECNEYHELEEYLKKVDPL